VLEQIVAYRLESRGSEGWSLWKNWAALARALSFEQGALIGMTVGGGLLLLARRSVPGATLVAWSCASVGLLLAYSPLHGKHAVVMVPPMAIVGGAGLGLAWRELRSGRRGLARAVVGVGAVALLGWYAASAPAALAQSGQLMRVTADSDVDPALEQYAHAVRVIRSLTTPDEFVVTDHPYLAFLAERLVPPALVDTSRSRISSRSLRSTDAIAIASAHDPRLIVLWTDRLQRLREFSAWVEAEYRVVVVYNRRGDRDRAVYVPRDADLAAVRTALVPTTLTNVGADFGPLRLVGHGLDRTEIRRGEGANLTFQWELSRPVERDLHVITVLRGSDGQARDQQQEKLTGESVEMVRWEAGHWVFQNTFVQADARVAPGTYWIGVSVYDSRARRMVPLPDGREELPIAEVTVR
jgi:hypothetical protein